LHGDGGRSSVLLEREAEPATEGISVLEVLPHERLADDHRGRRRVRIGRLQAAPGENAGFALAPTASDTLPCAFANPLICDTTPRQRDYLLAAY
jgi:hypothetical protein